MADTAGTADPQRPLPPIDEPDTLPFWQATREQQFQLPVCSQCSALVWYPRAHCPTCGSLELVWQTIPQPATGVIYTFTVVRRHAHPFFATRVPYVVAWIDMDGGPRLLTEVIDVDPEQVRVGDRVALTWEIHEELSLPVFTPVGPSTEGSS
jgi:hypothetical protein